MSITLPDSFEKPTSLQKNYEVIDEAKKKKHAIN